MILCCSCKNINSICVQCKECNHDICDECRQLKEVKYYLNMPEMEELNDIRKTYCYISHKKFHYFEIEMEIENKRKVDKYSFFIKYFIKCV